MQKKRFHNQGMIRVYVAREDGLWGQNGSPSFLPYFGDSKALIGTLMLARQKRLRLQKLAFAPFKGKS